MKKLLLVLVILLLVGCGPTPEAVQGTTPVPSVTPLADWEVLTIVGGCAIIRTVDVQYGNVCYYSRCYGGLFCISETELDY